MDDPSIRPHPGVSDEEFEALTQLIPEAKKLSQSKRPLLAGILRQSLQQERQDATEAVSVYRVEDAAALSGAIQSLPYHRPDEIAARIAEWHLPLAEAQEEAAHWALRHQSLRGDLVVRDRLIPFQLIRLGEFTYLLLSLGGDTGLIAENFGRAFGRAPDVHSDRALREPDRVWTSWAWFMDPDRAAAAHDAEQLRQLWQDLEA
jgi:hypothetical protein